MESPRQTGQVSTRKNQEQARSTRERQGETRRDREIQGDPGYVSSCQRVLERPRKTERQDETRIEKKSRRRGKGGGDRKEEENKKKSIKIRDESNYV